MSALYKTNTLGWAFITLAHLHNSPHVCKSLLSYRRSVSDNSTWWLKSTWKIIQSNKLCLRHATVLLYFMTNESENLSDNLKIPADLFSKTYFSRNYPLTWERKQTYEWNAGIITMISYRNRKQKTLCSFLFDSKILRFLHIYKTNVVILTSKLVHLLARTPLRTKTWVYFFYYNL